MPNTYKNKVVFNGQTLIDLTGDTVTPETLLEGYTAHSASGQPIVGTATGGGVVVEDTLDTYGGTIRKITTSNLVTIAPKTVTANGTYNAADDNVNGYSSVTVTVGGTPNYQTKTVTPTKSSQNIIADTGYDALSGVTVEAIPNEYITTTDATASATDIRSGESAYVNGSKVTGTLVINKYYTGTSEPSSSLGSNGDIYLKTTS